MIAHRLRELAAALDRVPAGPPPAFSLVAAHAVGGLQMAGFGRDGCHLLVTSANGRGVFDCETGSRVARDCENSRAGSDPLTARGIGPLAGELVQLAGLFGGGLHAVTSDGWHAAVVHPDLLRAVVVLEHGRSCWWDADRHEAAWRLELDNPRAVGFSPDGRSLVLAESHTLTLYRRQDGEA